MSLSILGVGWGRTGTYSLKTALEILGFGPCYHMTELLARPWHLPYWEKALNGEIVDWSGFLDEYQSAVDYPACRHWRVLGQSITDLKYILTVRDPDTWYESVRSTLYSAQPNWFGRFKIMMRLPFSKKMRQRLNVFRYIERSLWEIDFEGRFEDKKFVTDKYNSHIDEITATIPADRLLVYNVKSGWRPLCRFLEVDIPRNTPFPVLNTRSQFDRFIGKYL